MSNTPTSRTTHRLALTLWRVLPLPLSVRLALIWRLNSHYLVGVVGIVFDTQGRLLLLHHTYRKRHPWGLPGGWLAGAERAEDGLVREIAEETGWSARVDRILWVGSGNAQQRIDLVYACTMPRGAFTASDEVDDYRYFAYADLPVDILPDQLAIITWAFAHRPALMPQAD